MATLKKVFTFNLLFKCSYKMMIGTSIFIFWVLFAVLGRVLYNVNPLWMGFPVYQPPSLSNPFGTDPLGRDILAQVIHGTWYSLEIGILSGIIATAIGIAIGSIGGYFGKMIDEILNLITNVILTLPTLALLIVIASYIKIRSEWIVILLIALTSWPWTARSVRAQVLSLKTREYIFMAKLSGLSKIKILIFEVLPNMLSYIVMAFALQMAAAITSEAGLSAIGLGPTAIISLGIILRWAISFQAASYGIWWWYLPPGIVITTLSLSLLLINDGLDELYNPKIKGRR